jgi:putative hemolysin
MALDPFALDDLPAIARPFAGWLLNLREYRRLYSAVSSARATASRTSFERRVLAALGIGINVPVTAIESLPANGPLVIAANHPHGILDGLAMLSVCRPVRPDVRVVTNHLLARIPELHAFCFFVDPFAGPAATARSLQGLRAAHLWLRRGGALIVFPAGEVAHGPLVDGSRLDSPWKPTMERLARGAGARLVRAQIDGCNSRMFYAAGSVHPSLRTALLAREFLKKRGTTITVELTPDTTGVKSAAARLKASPSSVMADEIALLPRDACLVESGGFQVFCAGALEIPQTLREIGRLREIAYCAVGEGTGRRLDLDRFDQRYRHLFLWDRHAQRVAGAYRIGRTDDIAAAVGVDGLYTRTLFRYDAQLLDRMGAPALELGRSFVATEYQKNYNALLLLWRGIGQFVTQHPKYRFLFGPVSISARYSETSHRLLTEFLRQHRLTSDLSTLVAAVNPLRHQSSPTAATLAPGSVDDLNRRVAQLEADGKGVPVLLRQYLKLNAHLIGLNVDPNFKDALDALMIVDLTIVDRAILARYLGRGGAAAFLRFHHKDRDTLAA